jgi:hypothetical protein
MSGIGVGGLRPFKGWFLRLPLPLPLPLPSILSFGFGFCFGPAQLVTRDAIAGPKGGTHGCVP